MKFGFAEKVVLAVLIVFGLTLSYALIFKLQNLLNISFVLLLIAALFYAIWHLVLYFNNLKAKDEKLALQNLVKFAVSLVLFLAILVLAILCFTSILFVIS